MDVLSTISTRKTPQHKKADSRQVLNSAGGYTFKLEPLAQARRFLILGTDGGTYYTSAPDLTAENAQVIIELATGPFQHQLVDLIVEVSVGGLAPKQNPAIFALAICASMGTPEEKKYALSKLSQVCRTGTHLFLFAKYVEQFRGWGRGLRKAVGDWYLDKPVDRLAYQAIKYRQREGWTHRDLLRLAHPKTQEQDRKDVFNWIVKGVGEKGGLAKPIRGYMEAQPEDADIPAVVREFNLPWEALPTEALNKPEVWEALFATGIPNGALLRQLPRLTNLGLLPDMGGITSEVCAQLADPERLKKARVHPISVLIAMRTYASGHGRSQTWEPSRKVIDALDAAFYAAYGVVEPMNKRTLIGLDVSGSMGAAISGLPLSAREAATALCLVTAAVEPEHVIYGFTSNRGSYAYNWRQNTALTKLNISARQRLDDAVKSVSRLPFGGTDCSLPMRAALENNLEIDTFIIYTDNETWHGDVHPHQALREYREKTGIAARSIVVGMTSTGFSIADPSDPLSLDVVGFDASVPNLISDFGAGR